MGCSPARPLNSPIVALSVPNQITDNNVIKVDHRVLSEKFIPIKEINPHGQIETLEALDILVFDPRNGVKKEYEIRGIPQYSSENVTLNGKWQYIESFEGVGKEIGFNRDTQHKVEKEFIKGSLRCDIQLYENFAEIVFKDMTVAGMRNKDDGKKEHFSLPIKRTGLRREAFGWHADDGVIRPIVREIEDILNFTTGVYTYKFDEMTITIDLPKKAFIDNQTAYARPLVNL